MNRPAKKWLSIALPVIAGVIALAIGWWPGSEQGLPLVGTGDAPPTRPSAADAGPDDAPADPAGVSPQPEPAGTAAPAPPPRGPAETPPATTRPEYELEPGVSMSEWKDALADKVREATPADFERHRERANAGDAEAAYWLHLYYLLCENAPRTDWQLDNRLSGIERYLDRVESSGGDLDPRRHDSSMADLEAGFRRCAFLGPEFDAGSAALDWLEIAADLGHMGAQRIYHFQARQLLTGFWYARVFERPELIPEFKDRADRYAKALLKTGHPQAYVLMARMLTIGDVYEQDYVKAHAYARAAELIGIDGTRADARRMQDWIARNLDPARVPDAEKMAQRILRER